MQVGNALKAQPGSGVAGASLESTTLTVGVGMTLDLAVRQLMNTDERTMPSRESTEVTGQRITMLDKLQLGGTHIRGL